MTETKKHLYKSDDQRLVSGVCGGLAEFLGIDPSPIRLLFLLLLFANGLGFIVYVIFAMILPAESVVHEQEDQALFGGAYGVRKDAKNVEIKKESKSSVISMDLFKVSNIVGVLVIASGLVMLMQEIVPWYLITAQARIPLLAVGLGLAIIVRSKRV